MLTMVGKDILKEEFSGGGEALIINGLLGCRAGWRYIFTNGMTVLWLKFIFVYKSKFNIETGRSQLLEFHTRSDHLMIASCVKHK